MKKLLQKIKNAIIRFFERIDEELAQIEAAELEDEAAPVESPVEMTRDGEAPQPSTSGSLPSAATPKENLAVSADAVNPSKLDWCWGGFNGSKSAEVSDAQIGNLKVTSSGMSYKWLKGGCEKLGASSKEDASQTLACLFVFDGAKWRGGKFDWISTSRTTRDLKNIESGYHGWDYGAFKAAKAFAFCIVSADGKRRTNVIVQG